MAIDALWDKVSLLLPLSEDLQDAKGHTVTPNIPDFVTTGVLGRKFYATDNIAYFDVQPTSLINLSETFPADTGFTKYTESSPGTTAVAASKYTITHIGGKNDYVAKNTISFAMPQLFVQCAINVSGTGATGYDNGAVGIIKDANNFLFASMDRLANSVRIQIKIAGTSTFIGSAANTWTTTFKLGLSLVHNSACVWADTGAGWVCLVSASVLSYYDFRTTGNLTGWNPAFGFVNGGGNSVWNFSSFYCGRFGGVGIRDMTLVTDEYAVPYFPSPDTVQFTATTNDARGAGYMGVFTYNLVTKVIAQTSVIMVSRSGKTYPDLNAHIIRYSGGNRRMLLATWGNGFSNSIQALHELFTTGDVLVGTNVVTMTAITLPGQTGANPGVYDPMMAWDATNSRWIIAYTIVENTNFSGNTFYPAVATSTAMSSFTLVAKDSTHPGYEGTKICSVDGVYFVTAGGPAGSGTTGRVYDKSLSYLGDLTSTFSGGADTQPHPMVFKYDGVLKILSFDNTKYAGGSFTWGNLRIYSTSNSSAALSSVVGTPYGAGKALHLDGVADHLYLDDSDDWDVGAGDFTLEVGAFFVSHAVGMAIVSQRDASTTNNSYSIEYSAVAGGIRFSYTTDGTTLVTVDRAWTPTDGAWCCISAIRTGTVLKLKVDGTQIGADYSIGASTIFNSSSKLRIGATNSATTSFFSGYLSDIRLTKDSRTITAAPTVPYSRPTISGIVYDALAAPEAKTVLVYDRSTNKYIGSANSDPTTGQYTFYPPDFGEFKVERIDELADPYWNDVVIAARLTGANGGTSFPVLVGPSLSKTGTVTTTTTTPTTTPFGTGSSALFTGAGSYLNTGALAAMLPGSVYTISGWVYLSALDATRTGLIYIGDTASNANRTSIGVYSNGSLEFYAESSSAVFTAQSSAGAITLSTWIHFAAVRNGPNSLLFVGGALVGSAVASGTEPTGNNFHLGASRASSAIRGMNGCLFDVQYTKRAVWLSNFTPPPAPFPVAPADGGSGENAIIYDRVIPGG